MATKTLKSRKLPQHRGVFSYARIPTDGGGVVYRLFRRDMKRVLHCEMRVFHPDYPRAARARDLNKARHQLRDLVDDIDLKLLGVSDEPV
jgi:hypothetical protein